MPNTTTEEIWEYEYDGKAGDPTWEFEEGEPTVWWIEEDDERSASWKANGGRGATGRIRSYTRTVTTSDPVVKPSMTKDELTSHLR